VIEEVCGYPISAQIARIESGAWQPSLPPLEHTNAQTAVPSDSSPGLIAQVTGGNPKTTKAYYDDSYPPTSSNPARRTVPERNSAEESGS
jgi:hypothetical protein